MTVHLRRTSWLAELRGVIGGRRTSASDDHRFGIDAPHAAHGDALADTSRRKRMLDCDGCCVTSEPARRFSGVRP